ncbi:hypothetical protein Tco_0829059 [Tanacetum coccineum]
MLHHENEKWNGPWLLETESDKIQDVFFSSRGCLTNVPLLLKNFLKSLTTIADSLVLQFLDVEQVAHSSHDSLLAFKAEISFLSFAPLDNSESVLNFHLMQL